MKVGNIELTATPATAVEGVEPFVSLQVAVGPWFKHTLPVPPDTAREMAAELLQAANVAEGKA